MEFSGLRRSAILYIHNIYLGKSAIIASFMIQCQSCASELPARAKRHEVSLRKEKKKKRKSGEREQKKKKKKIYEIRV